MSIEYRFCPICGSKLINISTNVKECVRCKERFYKNPVPAVASILFNKKREILLVKRGEEPKKGMWALPGGFMEVRETVEDAVIRETEEETGLKMEDIKLLDVATEDSKRYTTVLLVSFFSDKFSGEMAPGDDSVEVKFFYFKNIPEIAFSSHRRFINKFFEIMRWK